MGSRRDTKNKGVVLNKKLIHNLYFLVFVLNIIIYLIFELLYYFKILQMFLPFRAVNHVIIWKISFFIFLYLLTIFIFKKIHIRYGNKGLFAEFFISIIIYSFAGYLSMSVAYLLSDVIQNGFSKYIYNPSLIYVAFILPILPLYTWIGGLLNGVFLIWYRRFLSFPRSTFPKV